MSKFFKDQVIIAIDLTEAEGVVSLVRKDCEVAFSNLNRGIEWENFLQTHLKSILKTRNYDLSDINAFAVSEQSYSLTRGRIVKALVRGLADGLNMRVFEINLFQVLLERFFPNKNGQILFGYLADEKSIRFKYYDYSNEYFDELFDLGGSVKQLFKDSVGDTLNVLKVKTVISLKLANFIQINGIESEKFPEKSVILEYHLGTILAFSAMAEF